MQNKRRPMEVKNVTRIRRSTVKALTYASVQTVFTQLRGEEEEFLRAVEVGDHPKVKKTLLLNPGLNVHCTDFLGRTPLRLAVENENLEIVELLLDRTEPKHMYDVLLLAINLDHDDVALTILRHPTYLKIEEASRLINSETVGFMGDETSLFAAETTPLILAAQRNRYEIVSLLLQRGERIKMPHSEDCECHHCQAMVFMDELRFAKSRLNAYKGLASESYISLSSEDPILTSFEMRQKLKETAATEKHYREEYECLMKKLSNYVVKLMDNVRGNDELYIILREGGESHGNNIAASMARLKLALQNNEKAFVAHASCQKVLTSIWYGSFGPWHHHFPAALRPLAFAFLMLVIPLISLLYCIIPLTHVKKFLQIPFIKFVGQTASFIVFLMLILVFSLSERPTGNNQYSVRDKLEKEASSFTYVDNRTGDTFNFEELFFRPESAGCAQITICVFVLGLVWQECKQLYCGGFIDHFSCIFNFIDFISLKLYITSFVLRYVTVLKTRRATEYFLNKDMAFYAILSRDRVTLYHLYWLVADRYYWKALDPMIVSEAMFSVANVLSFSRLFYLFAANEKLGPLQVSLRKMIMDIFHFFVIFSIVVIAFMVGLNNLYWYYEPSVRKLVELSIHTAHVTNAEAFGTLEQSFTTVFWALFGMGDYQVVDLGPDFAVNALTGRVGYWVFGGYNLVAVIVLLNMLIAMMSRSFEFTQNEENLEWKFARADLYMDFMTDESFLPVPLNIIPSTYSIYRLLSLFFRSLLSTCKSCKDTLHHLLHKSTQSDCDKDPVEEDNHGSTADVSCPSQVDDHSRFGTKIPKANLFFENVIHSTKPKKTMTYQGVIKNIVKRLIFESHTEQESVEADLEELKQEMSSFRSEVQNNMKTQTQSLREAINMINAKLDIASALQFKETSPEIRIDLCEDKDDILDQEESLESSEMQCNSIQSGALTSTVENPGEQAQEDWIIPEWVISYNHIDSYKKKTSNDDFPKDNSSQNRLNRKSYSKEDLQRLVSLLDEAAEEQPALKPQDTARDKAGMSSVSAQDITPASVLKQLDAVKLNPVKLQQAKSKDHLQRDAMEKMVRPVSEIQVAFPRKVSQPPRNNRRSQKAKHSSDEKPRTQYDPKDGFTI